MRISDWSSDVCSSDLSQHDPPPRAAVDFELMHRRPMGMPVDDRVHAVFGERGIHRCRRHVRDRLHRPGLAQLALPSLARGTRLLRERQARGQRSEEPTSELQSLMRISYAVFCLKKKNINHHTNI